LLLARLKTVEITEHAVGLEQVDFLHLLLVKRFLAEDILGIHSVLHLCSHRHTHSPAHAAVGIVANLTPPVYACGTIDNHSATCCAMGNEGRIPASNHWHLWDDIP
jgi:hypothetical protein